MAVTRAIVPAAEGRFGPARRLRAPDGGRVAHSAADCDSHCSARCARASCGSCMQIPGVAEMRPGNFNGGFHGGDTWQRWLFVLLIVVALVAGAILLARMW